MKQHIAVLFSIILCATACAPALCAEEKPPEVTVKGPGFHFTVALTRSTYLEGEPVLAKCSITNDLKKTQKLVETCGDWEIVQWDIVRLPAREKMFHPERRCILLAPIPDDFYWAFRGGETKPEYIDLLYRTDKGLPAGDYAVCLTYIVPTHVQADWVGELTTQEMLFRVRQPQGKDAELLGAIVSSQTPTEDKQELRGWAERLERLARENPKSRFAAALQYRAATLRLRFDRMSFEKTLEAFVGIYPKIPYYSPHAYENLGHAYLGDKRWDDARKAYSLMPAGYMRQRFLGWVDRDEAKARDANN